MEQLQQIADSFTDKPLPFSYTPEPRTWFARLKARFGWKPKERKFEIKNLSPGNMVRISGVASQIGPGSLNMSNESDFKRNRYAFLQAHMDKLIYIVAVGLTNTQQPPPMWLIEELKWDVPSDAIKDLAMIIVARSNVADFPNTIVSICGLDILTVKETSLENTGEIIAPGPLSAA